MWSVKCRVQSVNVECKLWGCGQGVKCEIAQRQQCKVQSVMCGVCVCEVSSVKV